MQQNAGADCDLGIERMGAGLSLTLSSSPRPTIRVRGLVCWPRTNTSNSLPSPRGAKEDFADKGGLPLLAEAEGLFDFCCVRESFCPRDIVLIWFDGKTAGGRRQVQA